MVGAFGRRLVRIIMNHVYFIHSCLNESQTLIDSRTKLTKLSPAHPPKSQSSVGCVEFLGGPFSEVSTVCSRDVMSDG